MLTHPFSRHKGRAFVAFTLASALSLASCAKKAASPPAALKKIELDTRSSMNYFATPTEGRGGGGFTDHQRISAVLSSASGPEAALPRKVIRNGSLELLVDDVGQSIDKISSIATAAGGYVEKTTQTNSGFRSASVTIRVPSARLDQTIGVIRRLATVVEHEDVEARDVTREFVDLDARLRNAQAEETQYLEILKRATTIKDTLDVTEKLSDVRGRIEEMQGEMKILTTQIEMSSLEISVHSEAQATVAGIRWRPLVQAKATVNEMLSGLADWVDSVVSFIIYLPVIIVWLVSIIVLLVITVRVVRFLWRRLVPKVNWHLPWKRPVATGQSGGQGAIST